MSAVLHHPAPALPAAWRRPLGLLALVLAALFVLYHGTWAGMVAIWMRSDTFAHAFLVPPIALWLMWRKRAQLAELVPQPQPLWLLPMALAAALWLPGDLAAVNAWTQLMVTALLVLAVIAMLGTRVARELAFPLAFLFFMVPIGDFLLPTFMGWTADFTVAALRLSGVPVYREGLNFVIPSGSWSVVEACSGVRYLIASFMVGTLFAYLNFSSQRRRLLFSAVALAVPIVANWLRAYLIVMLGHLSGNKLAAGVDHLIYGWLFFGVIILAMFMIGARWAQPAADVPPAPSVQPTAPPQRGGLVAVLALVMLAAPAALRWHQGAIDSAPLPPLTLHLPQLPGASDAAAGPTLEPVFVNPSATARRGYTLADGSTVQVHVAYYRQQGPGRKLVSSENMIVASHDAQWVRTADGTTVDAAGNAWRSAELRNGGAAGHSARARLDVRQAYWAGGVHTAEDTRAAALGLWQRLRGSGDDAAMITVFTAGESAQDTAARLDRFTTQYLPMIQASLASAGANASGTASSTRSTTQP